MGYDKTLHPMLWQTLHYFAFSCFSVLNLYNCCWKRQTDIITSACSHWRKDNGNCLTWLFKRYICSFVQMGHKHKDMLKDYRSTLEQFCMAFYRNTFNWDGFYLILRFLHCSDNKIECDEADDNCYWLWKVRIIFDMTHMLNITAQLNI